MKVFKILVKNFDEHNEKAIGKTLPWFRCQSRLARSSKFLHLSSGAKHMWLWLLCEAAQSSDRVVLVSARDVSREVHVKPQNIPNVFSELRDLEWIQILSSPKPLYEKYETRRDETEKTNECPTPPASDEPPAQTSMLDEVREEPPPKPPPPQLDFESLYLLFPRHEGKAGGMKQVVEQVKTVETFGQLKQAIENYAALTKHRKTETQFMKLWSTFIGTKKSGYPWREYIARPAELDKRKYGDHMSDECRRTPEEISTEGMEFSAEFMANEENFRD